MTLRENKEMMTSTYFLKHGGLTAKVPICVKCQESQIGFLARTIWFYDKHILGWLIRMLKDSKHLNFDKILSLIQIAATQLQYCNRTEKLKLFVIKIATYIGILYAYGHIHPLLADKQLWECPCVF